MLHPVSTASSRRGGSVLGTVRSSAPPFVALLAAAA
jgi:hypothetical protein